MAISSRLNLKNSMQIPGYSININSNCFIIAEIGINHGGDYIVAQEMIDAAFDAGADAVKLQIVDPDDSYSKNNESYSIFSKAILNEKQIYDLVNKNINKGMVFATPGDISSFNKCINAKVQLYKVSSGLLTNRPLINLIAKSKKPMIFSSGMATLKEIKSAIEYAKLSGCEEISVLQCTSIYPAPEDTLNLSAMKTLEKSCNCIIGYSDHCLGWLACNTAVALGAKIIEKHFTLDNKLSGADHKISLNHRDFGLMVKDIRSIEKMYGNSIKEPHKDEIKKRDNLRRYCVAKNDIFPGDVFNLDNVIFRRLGEEEKGIEALKFDKIENKKSNKFYRSGAIIV
jgi:N,N'-diacetyllegionaminate synthase